MTVAYNTEYNLAAGYVKVEWPGLSSNVDGDPFNCSGLRLGSIHYGGTFGGGTVKIMASNELTPTNFSEFQNSGSPGIQTRVDGVGDAFLGSVKPSAGSSVSNVTVALIFTIDRQ